MGRFNFAKYGQLLEEAAMKIHLGNTLDKNVPPMEETSLCGFIGTPGQTLEVGKGNSAAFIGVERYANPATKTSTKNDC